MATDSTTETEEVEFWERIQKHQKNVPKPSSLEESRTVVDSTTRAVLSTFSRKYEGFPFGSMVGFAADSFGRPILAISSLSPHTTDLENNPKCSFLVSRNFGNQSEALVTIIGNATNVSEADSAAVREIYLKKNPDAFWVDFGDFKFVIIEPEKVRFTANIATFTVGASVAEFSGSEYKSSHSDPIAPFEVPIAGHMNRDHEEATIAMVEHEIGLKVASAKIVNIDRFGFKAEVPLMGKDCTIRLPFPRPAQDRKDVKDLIVEMTKAAKAKSS